MFNPKSQDLSDADSPERVAIILRNAAAAMSEAPAELSAAWQDMNAGKVWADFARILERAADSCERARQRRGV